MAKAKAAKSKSKAKPAKAVKKPAPKAAQKVVKKAAPKTLAKAPVKVKPAKAAQPVAAKTKAAAQPAMKFESSKAPKSSGMKRFSPLDDRIVIERVVGEEKTAGGLYIPDSAQEKPTTGRVVAVGRGHRDAKGRIRPCDVKIGDTVLFTAWSGSEIELEGVKYVIMREPDLLGVTNV